MIKLELEQQNYFACLPVFELQTSYQTSKLVRAEVSK